jgi:hypothetical protein
MQKLPLNPLQRMDAKKADELLKAANAWVKAHGGFESYKGVATQAVAEHQANMQGLTLYDCMVGTVLGVDPGKKVVR